MPIKSTSKQNLLQTIEEVQFRSETGEERLDVALGNAATACGVAAMLIGLAVLAGWALKIQPLTSVLPGLATMKPNTALGLVLAGVALTLRHFRGLRLICAACVLVLAGLSLAQDLSGAELGTDSLLFRDLGDAHTIHPGRMAPFTAFNFLFDGLALLLLGTRRIWVRRLSEILVLLAGFAAFASLLGYAYGAEELYRLPGFGSIALLTALALTLLAMGLICAHTNGLAQVFVSGGPGGRVARWFALPAVVTPALIGWLALLGQRAGILNAAQMTSVFACTMIFVLTVLIWRGAMSLNAAEARQRQADVALHRHSAILAAINRVLELGLGPQKEEEMCQACLGVVEEATGSVISFIGEIRTDGFLHNLATSNPAWDACKMHDQAAHRKLPDSFPVHGIYGRVLSDGKSLIVNDPASPPARIGLPPGHLPWTSFLGVPLLREGKTVGMIAVGNRKNGYRIEDQQILEAIAPVIAETLDRKRAEKELRESEEHFRIMFDSHGAAMLLIDPDTGAIVDANEAAATFYRYTRERLRSMRIDQINQLPPEQVAAARGAAIRENRNSFIFPHRLAGGDVRWVEVYSSPATIQGRPMLFSIIHDTTERKAAEEALERTRDMLAEAQKIAHLGSFEYVATTQTTIWSEEEYRIYGLDPAGPSPAYDVMLVECIHPGDAARLHETFTEAMRSGSIYELEHRILRPDGSIRWVYDRAHPYCNEKGNLLRYVGATLDITERKATEEALRRSEARWNAAIENFAEGAIIATEDEQVIYWNPAARKMHGFTRQDEGIEPLEKTPVTFQLWTPDGSHMLELDEWPMRRIKRGESVRNLELRIRRPDQGWEKIFSFSGTMVDTAGGERLIFLTCHDLTELRNAEQALQVSDQRFRLALRNAPVSVAAQDCNLRYIWAYNQRTAPPEEIIGKLDSDIFTPEEAARITEIKRRVLNEGVELREHLWLDRPSGRIFLDVCWEPVRDQEGNVTGVASATVDLTPIKTAEEALRQSREDLDRAQAVGQIGWWRLDTRMNVLTWSPENHRIFGVPEGTPMTYEYFLSTVHPDDRQYVDTQWAAGLRGEPYDIEHRIVADGQLKWVREKAYLEFDSDGALLGGFGITQDITTRKRAEEALKTSLREKEVLLKEIHHRVKNNMQVISSLVDLQADQLGDATIKAVLQDVTHRVRSMALVHEKLYQSADMAKVDFADYAQTLLGYLWRVHGNAASRIRLTLDLDQVQVSINAAVPCGLILNELATNALKHAFKKDTTGEVIVSLRGSPEGEVCLRVRDSGTGLPSGFDWRKTKSLGLYLVQILAGQLSATVDVSSVEGTEFSISFGGSNQ